MRIAALLMRLVTVALVTGKPVIPGLLRNKPKQETNATRSADAETLCAECSRWWSVTLRSSRHAALSILCHLHRREAFTSHASRSASFLAHPHSCWGFGQPESVVMLPSHNGCNACSPLTKHNSK
uniref:Putative secreted protein n=1 Tax=Anopheles triannulatus TaxID=58253 RepID=A0A2M4B697_9DIPT